MDLLSYFRVLRRRWWVDRSSACWWGRRRRGFDRAQLDGGSAPSRVATFYKATHTSCPNSSERPTRLAFTNLDQIARARHDRPRARRRRQEARGGDSGQQLAEQITTLTNSTRTRWASRPCDPPDEAVTLADAFADELVANMIATDQERYNQANKDASDRLDVIQAKIDALTPRSRAAAGRQHRPAPGAAEGAQQPVLEAPTRFPADAPSQSAPASPLSTLHEGGVVPITAAEYDTRLAQGQLGQNNLQADTATAVLAASASATGLSTRPRARGCAGRPARPPRGGRHRHRARTARPPDPHPGRRRDGLRTAGARRGARAVDRPSSAPTRSCR